MSEARNLVFVRCGTASLHPRWLAAEPQRNWDLFLSQYEETPRGLGEIDAVEGGYNKFLHFAECVRDGRIDLSRYRGVLLADEDVLPELGSLSSLFRIAAALQLAVAHPALSWRSYWSHRLMLRNPLARWRETNFAEVMAPLFDGRFLAESLERMPVTRSTWGVDYAYCALARAAGRRIGLIDEATVIHTRPISRTGRWYRKLLADGVDPAEEERQVLAGIPAAERRPRLVELHAAPGLRGAALLIEQHKRDLARWYHRLSGAGGAPVRQP